MLLQMGGDGEAQTASLDFRSDLQVCESKLAAQCRNSNSSVQQRFTLPEGAELTMTRQSRRLRQHCQTSLVIQLY